MLADVVRKRRLQAIVAAIMVGVAVLAVALQRMPTVPTLRVT